VTEDVATLCWTRATRVARLARWLGTLSSGCLCDFGEWRQNRRNCGLGLNGNPRGSADNVIWCHCWLTVLGGWNPHLSRCQRHSCLRRNDILQLRGVEDMRPASSRRDLDRLEVNLGCGDGRDTDHGCLGDYGPATHVADGDLTIHRVGDC
jgi:hypothetical protein